MSAVSGPTIVAESVSRWFGNVVAVNDVSFEAYPGITGLLGPNGAGKTTLLHMLAGFLRPSAGRITVLGEPVWQNPELYRRVGIVPERESVYPFLTGWEFVRVSAALFRVDAIDDRAQRAIQLVGMEEAARRPIGTYSKGMRQRIKVAAALVHDPEVLILDEPFNGTDPRQRLQLMDLFRSMAAQGRTIIVSSHILEEVERLADRVLVMYAGRLAAAGEFRALRRLMTDRPHTFTVRSSDDRTLAAALVVLPFVRGVELTDGCLEVRTTEYGPFTRALPRLARERGIRLIEVRPADESLESVFAYLVNR